MRALWLSRGDLVPIDYPLPAAAGAQCVVRVIQAGICGTDLALHNGLYDFEGIPGHEFVGRVEQGPAPLIGKRVVADINVACLQCEVCRRGEHRHCSARRVLGLRNANGAFAERILVPTRNLHVVPDGVDDDHAVFAEPLAAALAVLDEIRERDDRNALVVGAGRLGQLMVRVLAHAGWQVHCHGRGGQSLERLPIGVTRSHGDQQPSDNFGCVVDTSGTEAGLATAFRSLRPRSTLVLKSTLAGRTAIDLNRLVVDEIRLLGSRCGSMSRALAWLERERHDLDSLISHRFPVEQGHEAFATSADSASCKVLLVP